MDDSREPGWNERCPKGHARPVRCKRKPPPPAGERYDLQVTSVTMPLSKDGERVDGILDAIFTAVQR